MFFAYHGKAYKAIAARIPPPKTKGSYISSNDCRTSMTDRSNQFCSLACWSEYWMSGFSDDRGAAFFRNGCWRGWCGTMRGCVSDRSEHANSHLILTDPDGTHTMLYLQAQTKFFEEASYP